MHKKLALTPPMGWNSWDCYGAAINEELFHYSYQRYLENQIREVYGLEGTPVRFVVRERGEKKF